jgi:hypothetical protein
MSRPFNPVVLWLAVIIFIVAGQFPANAGVPDCFSQFIGLTNFESFTRSQNSKDEDLWLSPKLKTEINWNELIVSWNAHAPTGTWLKIEASAVLANNSTKFYVMGLWTRYDQPFPRTSVSHQKDGDGDVDVDTLKLLQCATAAQIRLTLGGTNGLRPTLKFLGLAVCNTNVTPEILPPNRAAWGKIIPTPERSQQSYPGGSGCPALLRNIQSGDGHSTIPLLEDSFRFFDFSLFVRFHFSKTKEGTMANVRRTSLLLRYYSQ